MKKVVILSVLFGFIGAVAGALLAAYGIYYGCVAYDFVHYPNGTPTGGGAMAVGWLLWLPGIPLGFAGGLIGGIKLARRFK